MSLIETAASLFKDQLGAQGSNLDLGNIMAGLKNLLPTKGGDIDLGNLVTQFMGEGGGLADMAKSWLGNGANANMSGSQIMSVLGSANVSSFAEKLGLNSETAADGLSNMIPSLIDKSSDGGSLISSGMMKSAKGMLGKMLS